MKKCPFCAEGIQDEATNAASASVPVDLPARREPRAYWSLVWGIVGICCIPFIPSILAIKLGKKARATILESKGRLPGGGAALAGIVLGWVGMASWALALCVLLARWVIVALAGAPTPPN